MFSTVIKNNKMTAIKFNTPIFQSLNVKPAFVRCKLSPYSHGIEVTFLGCRFQLRKPYSIINTTVPSVCFSVVFHQLSTRLEFATFSVRDFILRRTKQYVLYIIKPSRGWLWMIWNLKYNVLVGIEIWQYIHKLQLLNNSVKIPFDLVL